MGKAKRERQMTLYFKRVAVVLLIMAMLLQPIPGFTESSVQSAEAAVTTGDYIDLEQTLTELYQGDSWSGSSASVNESGTKATVTVNNFGHGGSNEWGIQYMVKDLGLKSGTKYQVEFDITSTIDKEVFIKLDDSGLLAEPISLTAGATYHYSKEAAAGNPSADKQFLYFALGRKGNEASDQNGTVTIENLRVKEVAEVNYINLEQKATELYQGDSWSGSSASVNESGTKATVTVNNFGHGGSNEWGIQYMVKDLGLKSSTEYLVEFDITSTIDKEIFLKLDDTGLIAEPINLSAGVTYHYSKEAAPGTPSADKQTLFFALGRTGSEANDLNGTVTIENVRVEAIDGAETAADITVNKKGTSVKFQLAKNAAAATAKVFYAICNSEAEANGLTIGDAAFKECIMTKKPNGIWEVSEPAALTDGQIIRYYFEKDGLTTAPVNYTFLSFTAVDYTYDNRTDLAAAGYNLAWADEFDGTELDTGKWSFQLGTKDPNGGPEYWGNEEKEYYTDSNHVVKDGKLVITAKQESKEGMSYTSTRIRTKTDEGDTLYAAKYGRIEARMKLPAEEGLWPAFWMLPVDANIYGTWAASGELDIMEARGRIPDKVGGAIHYGSQWPDNTYYGKDYTFDSTTDISAYHLYSVEWEPGKITWLVDDVPYFSTENFWSKNSGNAENFTYGAPFDVPFYIIFNLAVGGTFDSAANLENAALPADMEVDYVRVYKKSDAYYQNLEDNLTTPVANRDTTSFESPAYQPIGVNGDYIGDTAFNTLKTAAEVKPEEPDWQFFVGEFGGEAAVTRETLDGTTYAKAGITKGGDQNYSIQLIKHLPFANGYTYEISFDAKASAGREFVLKPSGDSDNGWAGYGLSRKVNLTTAMTHYTHRFTMDKDSDPTARLEFDLGLGTGDVWIGNVAVKQVEPEETDTTDIFKNPDQNGGNHIYNGSFDQGTGKVAFWHTENAVMNVPRVINPEYDIVTGDKGDFSYRAFVTANDNNARIYQNGIWLQQSDIYQLGLDLSSQTAARVSAVLTSKDGSRIYMKETFEVPGTGTRENYTVNFAMSKGVTDREAVFALIFEKGSTVSVDNIRLLRTTNNNVTIDYSDVVIEPIKTDSTGWINNLNNGTVSPATNQEGEITSQTVTNQLTYMSMLYIPVTVKKGITYHLSFQAKAQQDNSVMVNIQEDNSWAVTMEEKLNLKAEEWQEFKFTLNSTLTNGSNPIFLKFLLSGPDVGPGIFKVKNVTMTAEVLEGAKDAPADTIINKTPAVKGSDYVIELKDGEYKTKFFSYVEKPDRKALVMVNGAALADGAVKNDSIVIPASSIGAGAYKIELALEGYNNIVLTGTVREASDPGNGGSNGGNGNNNGDINTAKPVIVTQPVGGKYAYRETAASLTVSATGDGVLSYQWYRKEADSTSSASAISGATGANYIPSTAKVGKTDYYCVVTNTNKEAAGVKYATVTSNTVTVEVIKAANKITGVRNLSKVYSSGAFALAAKAKGAITYKSSNTQVVTVDSKSGKVTIKGTGKATITITAAGNDNYKASSKKITVTVIPKKAVITSLKAGKESKLTVTWAKDAKASGYVVQYSASSNFINAKTVTIGKNTTITKTISKLKGGKTYYVRVRAYTKAGTTDINGSWSVFKKVAVK